PAPPQDHRLQRLHDDDEIERNRKILDVVEIVLELFNRVFDACPIRVADLRPAGHARLDYVTLAVERDALRQLAHELGAFRSRSDETHFPDEHIPQLRHFVEARPPEKSTNRGHARVVRGTPYGTGRRFRVDAHRAELVHHELAPLPADP